MMNPWRPYPLIRLVLAYIAGILTAILHLAEVRIGAVFILIPVALALLLALFPSLLGSYRLRWIRGVIIFSGFILIGNQMALDFLPSYFQIDTMTNAEKSGIFLARIDDQPAKRTKTVRVMAELFRYDSLTGDFQPAGMTLVYIRRDGPAEKLHNGDLILAAGNPELLPLPGVPGGFDMRHYYARKGIFHQIYLPAGKWKFLCPDPGFSVRRMAGKVRDRLLTILQENNVTGEEFAVAGALLLGYVSEIDKELLNDYSASGAMHILSVSGMHVGVICLFLEFVLSFLEKRRKNSGIAGWVKAVVMIGSIWFYALITGLSPPVQRAAIMLSMVIAGKNMQRQPEILNILAASLFIVLLSDPFLVMDVGCQFSYLAVVGIVVLQRPIYDLYVTSKWFPDKVWSLIAVSVAAQLITFPLALFVFHQFPNYFLLTNLCAVPLSSLIIYTGIVLLAAGQVSWLGPLIGEALSFLVWLLNQFVRMVDSLPGSTLKGIFLSMPEMFLLYAIVAFLFLFFLKKRKQWLFLTIVSLILFASSSFIQKMEGRKRSELIVYDGKPAMVDFIQGDSHFLLMQDPLTAVDDYTRNMLVDHWTSGGVRRHFSGYLKPEMTDTVARRIPSYLTRCGNTFLFHGQRIIILNNAVSSSRQDPLETDLLIITDNPRMKMEEILRIYRPERLVIDGSNAWWRVEEWKKEAERAGVKVHVVGEQGMFRWRDDTG
ncbi:MAG TPA: ComEC/Rec2 family competence protein [Bacteroidales bacterium]|nr:ComEC/Rec2 family competence protein [Bacteroidales bacterium]